MQGLQDMYATYADEGFVVVSVVVQDEDGNLPSPDDAALWQDELGLTFIVLADVDGTFWPAWDPDGVLPTTTVVDADGVVHWYEAGGTAEEQDQIEAIVVDALP